MIEFIIFNTAIIIRYDLINFFLQQNNKIKIKKPGSISQKMSSITHQQLSQNFLVIRVLGEGSFGKAFLVRHKDTFVQYAMKKYSKYHILKNGKEKALIRSSGILQALDHKNIIKFLYYAFDDKEDEIFLIFEACKKGSLEQIKTKIYKMKQLSLVKQVMYQLAEALLYLKSVCVAHRDMKPSNICFNSDGELKVIDFDQAICFKQLQPISNKQLSFARQLSQQTASMKTYSRRSRANSFVGTQMYMSPEMKHSTITDQRGDIWAYGCILYQMVSGNSFMGEYQQDQRVEIILENLQKHLKSNQYQVKESNYIIDLLRAIMQQNPQKRLPVAKILQHNFFGDYKSANISKLNRTKFKKFLRGNYNLSDPRNVLDALNMDLIGMKQANEKFLQLSQYPILLKYEKFYSKQQSYFQKVQRILKSGLRLTFFEVNYIFGGSRYFKVRSTKNQEKKHYILYDQIDSIRIQRQQLLIQGSNSEKWNLHNGHNDIFKWRFTIKSLTNDQYQLGLLCDILHYICND